MSDPLLKRKHYRPPQALSFVGELSLARARTHEFCGPSRHTAALWAARAIAGPVIWITPDHARDRLNPDGMRPILDPSRFVFVTPVRGEDLLWSMEEALRAGAVELVVAELLAPPAMTPVRRLHLAAEAGAKNGGQVPPTGLLLTPGDGGAQGIESRWHLSPCHSATELGWVLQRRRARMAPPEAWQVTPKDGDFELSRCAATLP